ncbi:MAG TPA: hypothetical protein ENF33_01705 [Nitrososphaeria archaeon]|nr:hypothetical protein [Nitrososphaeria archaeon]
MMVNELKHYRAMPYEEKKKIVSLVLDEAERMKQEHKRINYHELSRIVLAKTGIILPVSTIWRWLTGICRPMGKYKATRRPPDKNGQIVRGLSMTDLRVEKRRHTICLCLNTTKDFFSFSVQRLLSDYGRTTVKPALTANVSIWRLSVTLDYEYWVHELQKPIKELTREEKMKLLSGVISGDGWISISARRRVAFMIGLTTSEKHKAQIFHRILKSLGFSHSFARKRRRGGEGRIKNFIIRRTAPYEYEIIVRARTAVKHLLSNLRLLQPFREVKRILTLRFIEKGVLDRDFVKPVWDYLRFVEKYSTIRSQIRACELIPDEKFDEKHLNKQRMLKQLRRELYEYADMVRELKPTATRIISDLRPSP